VPGETFQPKRTRPIIFFLSVLLAAIIIGGAALLSSERLQSIIFGTQGPPWDRTPMAMPDAEQPPG